MKKGILLFTVAIFALALSACSANDDATRQSDEEALPVNSQAPLNVDMINAEGKKIGMARLSETSEGVKIELKAEGLEPGTKAIHIHETAKCEAPEFTSAGSHFNPGQRGHGFDNPKGFHAGDLPNIEISGKGTVNAVITAPEITLKEGEKSILDADGSALVIHENADDYKTDPAGNSGARIVCGAINK